MSTQLFLRLAASDLGGAGQQALSVTRGAASHTAVTNTTASGTNIQVTATAAGQALTWFSAPLAGITISGSVTVNIRGLESSASANSKAGITIEHTDSLGNVLSTIVANTAVPTTSSEYTTADTAKNASFTPTSTALNYGDRIKVTLFVKNQGTMGGGFTVTNSYDGPTAAAAGDTYVTFTENLFPAYSGGPQGWSSPAGVRAAYVRTGICMATRIPAVVAASPSILTASLPGGIVSRSYAATLSATGGTPAYTWSISAGSLPAGLTLNPSTGIISGTPTGPPGTISFTVEVTDSLSNTATKPLSIQVIAAPVTWCTPARTRIKLPPRGRIGSNKGGPVKNPVPPPPVHLPHGPVQAKLLPPPRRGRMAAGWGVILFVNPQAGPVFTQRTTPVRAHPVLPPRGRIGSSRGKLVVVPRPAKIYPAQGPVRARVAPPFSKGRIYSHPGAPVRNPQAGPVFTQRVSLPLVQPLPRRGTCRTIRFYPLVTPPVPPVTPPVPLTAPVRAHLLPVPRGRVSGSKGGPVQNPVPPVVAPFRQQTTPARIRPGLPARGRTVGNKGAPVRNSQAGPVFRQATQPARRRITLPPRGRIGFNPGGPVENPSPAITGLFNIVFPCAKLTGVVKFTLSGPAVSLSADVTRLVIVLPPLKVSLTATVLHQPLNLIIPKPSVSLTAINFNGKFAIKLPVVKVTLTGGHGHVGSFSIIFNVCSGMEGRLLPVRSLPLADDEDYPEFVDYGTGSPYVNWSAGGTPYVNWSAGSG